MEFREHFRNHCREDDITSLEIEEDAEDDSLRIVLACETSISRSLLAVKYKKGSARFLHKSDHVDD